MYVYLNILGRPLKVCYLCEATKGASDLSMCFTDISPGAAWRATFRQQDPWSTVPYYSGLVGFDLVMVVPDLLHTFNLGIGRDMVGSILKTILADETVFQGGDLKTRFAAATESLKAFAKSGKYTLKMKKLTKTKVTWETKKYPELRSSGSDTHIVSIWLEDILQPFQLQYPDFMTLLWSSNRCLKLLYKAHWFLSDSEKNSVEMLGRIFASTYLRLASNSLHNNQLMWRVRPKFHMFIHLTSWSRRINCAMYSCWMDEDWLKKVAHVMKLTATTSAQRRVLQRWLLAVPHNLEKVKCKEP